MDYFKEEDKMSCFKKDKNLINRKAHCNHQDYFVLFCYIFVFYKIIHKYTNYNIYKSEEF